MVGSQASGLFGRLEEAPKRKDGKNQPPLRRQPRGEKLVAERVMAIKRQLEVLLNARKGASASTPDFGLADFNDASVGSSDMIGAIVQDVWDAIERYEPRIVIEKIDCEPDEDMPLAFDFRIVGHILAEDKEEQVEIDMVLNGFTDHYTVL